MLLQVAHTLKLYTYNRYLLSDRSYMTYLHHKQASIDVQDEDEIKPGEHHP